MKKNLISTLFLILIVLVAIFTNPGSERHKETIKSKLNIYLQKVMKDNLKEASEEEQQAGQAIGMLLGGAIIDRIIDNTLSTNNYLLFSTTKISWEGETKIIGIGAFGNVFLTGKLDEALNQGLLENNK